VAVSPWVTLAVGGFQPPVAPGTALIPLFHIGAGMLCHWKVETTRSEFDHNRTDRAAHSDSLCTIGECMKADRWFALTRWWSRGDSNCRSSFWFLALAKGSRSDTQKNRLASCTSAAKIALILLREAVTLLTDTTNDVRRRFKA
jgi:hypothetical protein